MEVFIRVLLSLLLPGFSSLVLYLYIFAWLKPEKIRKRMRKQGISGPRPSLFFGNLPEMKAIETAVKKARIGGRKQQEITHDHASILFPYHNLWRQEYGSTFFYSNGNMVTLYVGDLDLAKEICLCTSLDLGKPSYVRKNQGALIGGGVLSSDGDSWAHQRKIIAPQFYMDKVKGMVNVMVESAIPLLDSWEARVELDGGSVDIRVDEDLKCFAADVISRTCFGSSYSKGEKIFYKIRKLQQALATQNSLIGIPGLRYLPIKSNREIWRLGKEIKMLILKLVREREGRVHHAPEEDDLLQVLLESVGINGEAGSEDFVVDNCKNIYFAGHETVATTTKWALVLLAQNPEWQARVRSEVMQVCGDRMPTAEMLRKITTLTMVIQETMRLYPPAPAIVREALQEMRFGGLTVPKGTLIWIPRITFHHDPKLWGPNANEFNPERFAKGVSYACKVSQVYNPFGIGPRTCLGNNFALVELSMILSLILSRFVVSLSPSYNHSLAFRIVLEPEHGVNLLVRRV